VPETLTNARRWNSFVCPGCRFVFRVPQDHDGRGVVCPACRVMLRLPGPDDELVPLVIPPSAAPEPVEEIEYDEGEDEAPASGGAGDWKFIASLVVPALLLLGGFAWWMMPDDEPARPAPLGAIPSSAVPIVPEPAARSMMLKVEAAVRGFLEAPTVAEALRHVRDPEQTRPKMDAWLAGRPYAAPGFHEMLGETVAASGSNTHLMTVQVRTGDFELREIVLVEAGDELRVDWESWVGWSEMPWAEFERERPAEPKWFRVNLSKVDYYNFAFKDDAEWSSYRLDDPDGTASLYGYVPRTSKLDQQIRPLDENAKVKLLLRLKYPPDALSGNQVLIDDVAGEEWVAPDEPEKP
jgi:hypothetical protein